VSDTQSGPQREGFSLPQGFREWTLAAIIVWTVVGVGFIWNGFERFSNLVLPSLTSFFIAGLLLAIFRPITRWLKAHRFNDGLAALGGILSILVVMSLLAVMFIGPIISGAAGVATSIPSAVGNINEKVQAAVSNYHKLPEPVKQTLQATAGALSSHVTEIASNSVGMLVSGVTAIFSLGLAMFLALILTFWFLKDGPRIAAATLKVVPKRYQEDVCVIASSFDKSFSGYLLATAINCSVIFILDGLGFTLIGLPNAWFIAAMVAILGIIPYLGSILSFFVAFIVGLTVGPTIGIATGVLVFVVDQIVYSFIGPIVAGKTVTLHPVMIIFSLCIGASIAGFLGAILSIPVAAAIRVVYIYYRDRDAAVTAGASAAVEPAPEEA
jgi:predicted PurR-regulated permease PerM